jgi:hypothetical protein
MVLSARMLALIQKIEAADAEHFAALRERGKQQAAARARTMEKKLANLRAARAIQARSAAKRKAKSQRPAAGEAR